MQRSIVTQVGIEDLKFALSEVAENLSHHINDTLSKAHGINIINGYTDVYGNDLTTYQDSTGAVVGNYFVLFTVGDAYYFAPANITALAGQPETNGSIISENTDTGGRGHSSWITEYTSNQVLQAQAMLTDVLVPHTREPHWSTHGSMQALLQPTYNNLGAQVGTHVIQIKYKNSVYSIPVSNRFGGPIQAPRIGSISNNLSVYISEGSSNVTNISIPVSLLSGTKPVEYHFQYKNGSNWADFTPGGGGSGLGVGEFPLPGWSPGINYVWPTTATNTFTITYVSPGSGDTRSVQLRCRVTNEAVPDTGPTSGVITNVCTFTASDDT